MRTDPDPAAPRRWPVRLIIAVATPTLLAACQTSSTATQGGAPPPALAGQYTCVIGGSGASLGGASLTGGSIVVNADGTYTFNGQPQPPAGFTYDPSNGAMVFSGPLGGAPLAYYTASNATPTIVYLSRASDGGTVRTDCVRRDPAGAPANPPVTPTLPGTAQGGTTSTLTSASGTATGLINGSESRSDGFSLPAGDYTLHFAGLDQRASAGACVYRFEVVPQGGGASDAFGYSPEQQESGTTSLHVPSDGVAEIVATAAEGCRWQASVTQP